MNYRNRLYVIIFLAWFPILYKTGTGGALLVLVERLHRLASTPLSGIAGGAALLDVGPSLSTVTIFNQTDASILQDVINLLPFRFLYVSRSVNLCQNLRSRTRFVNNTGPSCGSVPLRFTRGG